MSPACIVPPPATTPGGKPVIAVPGLTPRLPVTTVNPVLVTVVAPRTAKLCAEPSDGWADAGEALRTIAAKETMAASRVMERREQWISVMRRGYAAHSTSSIPHFTRFQHFSVSLCGFFCVSVSPCGFFAFFCEALSYYFQFVAANFARGRPDSSSVGRRQTSSFPVTRLPNSPIPICQPQFANPNSPIPIIQLPDYPITQFGSFR
jgi:hypothetical protein